MGALTSAVFGKHDPSFCFSNTVIKLLPLSALCCPSLSHECFSPENSRLCSLETFHFPLSRLTLVGELLLEPFFNHTLLYYM